MIVGSVKVSHGLKGMTHLTTVVCNDIGLTMKGRKASRPGHERDRSGPAGWAE